ncbi:MAG: aminomethyl-transferring glycine dehydrogenase subunit GcvPB [Nitrospinota bacterium]|nr:aminomethyl-transferring glycine dehydrogenase subunit GcvPB [Nitrospinota bacterium]
MSGQSQRGINFTEGEIFGRGAPDREGYTPPRSGLPAIDPESALPAGTLRGQLEGFPSLSEPEVTRHYTRMSQWNFAVDLNFYPLGSCTMKYNPRINEAVARIGGFTTLHPMAPQEQAQGTLQVIDDLEKWLCQISGMDAATLQPAAGAQGELVGLLMIRAALTARGNPRKKVLLPDSSHGTNPASAVYCGYEAVTLPSGPDGRVDMAQLDRLMDDETAALMVTNPNTLGIFESDIIQISKLVHDRGGFIYCDGANLNAFLGKARFGDMGVDVAHVNLHKTFSTPHGGGGPGSGPVVVKQELAPYLPFPVVAQGDDGAYSLEYDRPQSVGRAHGFFGNTGVLLRAAAYILSMGPQGLAQVAEAAVVNANYIRARLGDHYHIPYPGRCMHELVITDKLQSEYGVSTLDIAKALIDRGFHPPTIYFPTITRGAMMIEPTETESLETLDSFCEAMIEIADLAKADPESIKAAPVTTVRTRLDEATAARRPQLRCSLCG